MKTIMVRLALALALLTGAMSVGSLTSSTARAGVEYPWCAIYSEKSVGATNCGFRSYAQCMATLQGLGGICNENPAYVPPAPPHRKPRKPAR